MSKALFKERGAYCASEFGEKLLEKWGILTTAEVRLGRYVRGKRKGQIRGRIEWVSCTYGGWDWGSKGGGVKSKGVKHFRLETYDGEIVYSWHTEDCPERYRHYKSAEVNHD